MGQSLAKAVDDKGKRVKAPAWSGWVHIYKNGLLKSGYKRRFCRLDRDRLYYFKDERPKHTSKGCIHLHDVVGLASLPSVTTPDAAIQVPVALVTPALVYMLGFEGPDTKAAFESALGPAIPRSAIVAEGWSIVQLEHGQSKDTHFVRYYLVFLTSGDLLFFTAGDCRFLEARVRMVDLENVVVDYDTAAGNGVVLSPRSRARAAATLASPAIQLVVQAKVLSLEFDAKVQYELWRELLVDAAAGDYYGRAFLQRRLQEEQRKKYFRQAKLDDMLKKTKKLTKHKKQRQSLHDPWRPSASRASYSGATYDDDDPSEASGVSVVSLASTTSSSRKGPAASPDETAKKKKKMKKEEVDAATDDGAPATISKKKKSKKTLEASDGRAAETATKTKKSKKGARPPGNDAPMDGLPLQPATAAALALLPPAATDTPIAPLKKPKKPKGSSLEAAQTRASVAENAPPLQVLVETPAPTRRPLKVAVPAVVLSAPTGEATSMVVAPPPATAPAKASRVREDIFASPLSSPTFEEKRQALLQRLQQDYSPLSPKVKVEPVAYVQEPVPAPSTRRRQRSVTADVVAVDRRTDLAQRHQMLQADFERLCARLSHDGQSTKQARRLGRQIRACAQAIDTLGGLVLFPPTDDTLVPPILPMLSSLELTELPLGTVDVQGNWYTLDQKGGRRVRRWLWRHT
ncbi:hypothetical protein ACHHYP_07538 [Achlya hypogyna]|uniref:PH domain-containing protein n=1 Tax=Achlya hypogyna TaxID=1202772 RepID=A0A1V9YQX6_ACHHY|nr:hypothetical protein ACHHYP_07538 [Achlya hypogyna]